MSAGCSACETTHFDPFVKLKAKWLDYTVIAGSGVYTFTLKNVASSGDALVLYDPTRGRKEYFILEYRRPGTSYDAGRGNAGGGLPNAGLALWHIVEDDASQKKLGPPSSADNWYRKGVRLVRRNGSIPFQNEQALYSATNSTLFLQHWSDQSPSGFTMRLLDAADGPNPPTSIRVQITR
jgi:hypothetical protein